MKYDMKLWLESLKGSHKKKPLPILSFPCVSLLGVSVRELISDSELQARGMKAVADRTDAAASVSFMDLSLEAECFGATVVVSDDEVPTVKGRMINDADEAEALEVPSVDSGRAPIYIDAIKKATELIGDRPVLAGMIGPFSLAARLLDVSEIMMDCYDDPDMVHTVLEKVTSFLIDYAAAYKEAGYYVSHYHHSETESDGEICYLDIKMFAEPTGNTIADDNFIYIHFFDTEEGAKRFKEENTYNIGVWFFALPFGEFRWLKSRQFGKIGCSYFNSEMVRPLRRLV